jgi:RHH-type rel operon transcriptional repressor/antitoxin RelB
MKTSTISVRVSPQIAHRLRKLASVTDRSSSYLAAEAIEEYLNLQEWQVKAIHEGIKAADKNDAEDYEKVRAYWETRRADQNKHTGSD